MFSLPLAKNIGRMKFQKYAASYFFNFCNLKVTDKYSNIPFYQTLFFL